MLLIGLLMIYLNENQVYDLMMYKSKKKKEYSKSVMFNYIINNYIEVGDREGLACDIVKIFL